MQPVVATDTMAAAAAAADVPVLERVPASFYAAVGEQDTALIAPWLVSVPDRGFRVVDVPPYAPEEYAEMLRSSSPGESLLSMCFLCAPFSIAEPRRNLLGKFWKTRRAIARYFGQNAAVLEDIVRTLWNTLDHFGTSLTFDMIMPVFSAYVANIVWREDPKANWIHNVRRPFMGAFVGLLETLHILHGLETPEPGNPPLPLLPRSHTPLDAGYVALFSMLLSGSGKNIMPYDMKMRLVAVRRASYDMRLVVASLGITMLLRGHEITAPERLRSMVIGSTGDVHDMLSYGQSRPFIVEAAQRQAFATQIADVWLVNANFPVLNIVRWAMHAPPLLYDVHTIGNPIANVEEPIEPPLAQRDDLVVQHYLTNDMGRRWDSVTIKKMDPPWGVVMHHMTNIGGPLARTLVFAGAGTTDLFQWYEEAHDVVASLADEYVFSGRVRPLQYLANILWASARKAILSPENIWMRAPVNSVAVEVYSQHAATTTLLMLHRMRRNERRMTQMQAHWYLFLEVLHLLYCARAIRAGRDVVFSTLKCTLQRSGIELDWFLPSEDNEAAFFFSLLARDYLHATRFFDIRALHVLMCLEILRGRDAHTPMPADPLETVLAYYASYYDADARTTKWRMGAYLNAYPERMEMFMELVGPPRACLSRGKETLEAKSTRAVYWGSEFIRLFEQNRSVLDILAGMNPNVLFDPAVPVTIRDILFRYTNISTPEEQLGYSAAESENMARAGQRACGIAEIFVF